MKKAQKGNEKAFLKLLEIYKADIYKIAYVYVKNEDDALDVAQEVAYRAFKNIQSLNNPQFFKTWIIKIAITCSINFLKKRKRLLQLVPQHEEYIGLEEEDIPLSLSLQELLDELEEEEKSLVILKFYEGYTFREIADLLNIPLGTAKSVLYRALGKLRKQAKEVDFYD
ncbi:sigma-70 family RNA polymerase sigma factor [Rossellomorea vietnamensis]|uniref:sigma-70 family RNA polymerase sigma factor n=1 Tax=Rossellomorea vietnamensis TaxID=218284 RepID=UPI0020785417|nr:sigma-70 family RNA polymerase sigma factor [Rossellomorea vietnamensis]